MPKVPHPLRRECGFGLNRRNKVSGKNRSPRGSGKYPTRDQLCTTPNTAHFATTPLNASRRDSQRPVRGVPEIPWVSGSS